MIATESKNPLEEAQGKLRGNVAAIRCHRPALHPLDTLRRFQYASGLRTTPASKSSRGNVASRVACSPGSYCSTPWI